MVFGWNGDLPVLSVKAVTKSFKAAALNAGHGVRYGYFVRDEFIPGD